MPAPPLPAEPPEIDLDLDDLVDEPEERSTSQTRRLGSNVNASVELSAKGAERGPSLPHVVPLDEQSSSGMPGALDGRPASTPYLAGDVIDVKYRLTRIIGRGGMGAVWQAHNIPLDIDGAVKLIRRDRTATGAGERLLTEARAAARLMHPAIVRVFDFGETAQGDPFIVMELLNGESLNAILRRKKRLSPAVAVQTLLPVAAALVSAHGKGIVHRDLKPDNIIVVTDETGALVPKIVDFGIAKLLSPDVDRQVTMAGEVLGSPDYMSPEQARGADNVGEATDIWAFSVVLYELIAGRRPFDAPNYNALIAAILTVDPAPIMAHGVPDPALSGIIEHGLAKEIGARWPRMRAYGAALASWAVANGIEDDLMGSSIAKQWLTGAARRLFTVMPETGGMPLRSGPVVPAPSPWPPGSPGANAASRDASYPPRENLAFRMGARQARRASAQRAVLLLVAIVLIGATGVAVFLLRDRLGQARGGPVAASSAIPETSAVIPPAQGVAPRLGRYDRDGRHGAGVIPSRPDPTTEPAPTAAPTATASTSRRSGFRRRPRGPRRRRTSTSDLRMPTWRALQPLRSPERRRSG